MTHYAKSGFLHVEKEMFLKINMYECPSLIDCVEFMCLVCTRPLLKIASPNKKRRFFFLLLYIFSEEREPKKGMMRLRDVFVVVFFLSIFRARGGADGVLFARGLCQGNGANFELIEGKFPYRHCGFFDKDPCF